MKVVTPQDALRRLKNGNENFCNDRSEDRPRDRACRRALKNGQHPFAVVLTCSDSRVVPEFVFDAGLGDLFVVRVAGNVPNPSTLASIEFATASLGVKLIVVMGHSACGAVEVAIEGNGAGPLLNNLLDFIRPAVIEAADQGVSAVSRINSRNTAKALLRESSILSAAAGDGDVQIVASFYDLDSGRVDFGVAR